MRHRLATPSPAAAAFPVPATRARPSEHRGGGVESGGGGPVLAAAALNVRPAIVAPGAQPGRTGPR